MKVLVIGVEHARGTSRRTGSEYNISTVTYATRVEPVSREDRQVYGHGYRPAEIGIDEAVIDEFKEIKLPAVVDLRIEPDPANLRRNRCVGINQ